MEDYLVKALAFDGQVRAFVVQNLWVKHRDAIIHGQPPPLPWGEQ